MEERELVALIEAEVASSIGGGGAGTGSYAGTSANATTKSSTSAQLATERAMELDYYNSQPFGNERDGESQVVSSDVFDAVEGMLPYLLKTFTASDDAVEFQPEGMEDEEAAKQRNDTCNYVFYRQNNGFLVMYEWFKDALIQKNGVVKYWWDEKIEITEDQYRGLTEGEYLTLLKEDGIEVLEQTAYDDPEALEKKQELLKKLQSIPRIGRPAPQPTQPMQPGQTPGQQLDPVQMMARIQTAPIPQLHDCRIKLTKNASQIRIKAIPPEEFGISSKHNCISIQDAPFCYHRARMTMSELKQMGCPQEVLDEVEGEDSGQDIKPEVLARNRFIDESSRGTDSEVDPSLKEVWVVDCFIRLDYDDDGIAELRHIIMPGRAIWINEPSSHINFAAITPIIMPHRWIGKSVAEIVMDVQFIHSVLWRQTLNNLYLSNNPQKVVLGSQGGSVMADLDRLMTSRVGGILVEYSPNAIRNQEVPFVAGGSFQMFEYLQSIKENRTGNTRYNQGTDADSLNKTARGIAMIQSAAQQKLDLIARIFAETGVKDLFRGIAYFLSKYSSRKMTLRLRNKWVDIDPRQWKTQFDMIANVGLGTGNKDAQLVHLIKMNEMQLELMKTGRGYMVTDQNVYNLAKKMAENTGFKHPDIFVTDPRQVEKPAEQPNPEMLKIQQADAEAKMKIQSNEKIRQFDAQTQKEVETIKSQTLISIAQLDASTKEKIAQLQIASDAQIAIYKANCSLQGETDALDKQKLALGYESNILAIKKQVDSASEKKQDQVIVDTTGASSGGLRESIGAITHGMQTQADAIQQNTQAIAKILEQSGQQNQLAASVALLADAQQKTAQTAKTPRKHKIKKTPDGYEITSVV